MKLFIAISLIAIAFAPVAAASSAGVSTYGYGDCAVDGYAYNYNQANANVNVAGQASAQAQGGTYCSAYEDFFTGEIVRYSEVYAVGNACTAATGCTGYVGASWFSSSYGYCDMYVSGAGSLGCPAGNAPYVGALLP